MHFDIVASNKKGKKGDILVLPYWEKEKKVLRGFSSGEWSSDFLVRLEKDLKGKPADHVFSYAEEDFSPRVLLLCLGSLEKNALEDIRKAFSTAIQVCRKKKLGHVQIVLPEVFTPSHFDAMLDGLCMANYAYDALKRTSLEKSPTFLVKEVTFLGEFTQAEALFRKRTLIMDGVNLTRDLVNGNADDVKASFLVTQAQEIAKQYPEVEVKVLRKKELEKEGMGLMLAVNRGAIEEPALLLIHYKGDPKGSDLTAVVGKGVTYDTGGLNLKPTGSMETMKSDMAGAAAILGIMRACAGLKLKKNVVGVIASVENAIGPNAYKPGDVYISHAGKSVEISNTDAEGRLVLADAFSYVQKHCSPSRLIDFATLTGGVIIALGEEASGLFSNNDALVDALEKAAETSGERVWQLPLYPEYVEALHSSIADIKNARNDRKASAASGATFLQQFIEKDLPWAHFDIAGTAYLSSTSSYQPSHATGAGVKLMIEFFSQ